MLRSSARAFLAAVLVACLSTLSSAAFASSAQPAVVVERGEIAGAKFTLARPAKWYGGVLLLAHGLRAEDRPLVADLSPEHLAYKTLLHEGWIVAKTSYRRNGLIVADAIADIDALRDHIEVIYGRPSRVLLEGDSMGGLIVALMAERDRHEPVRYHGAVAVGAALHIRAPDAPLGLSLRPQIPLLFLTNQSELDGPSKYVLAEAERAPQLRPALFRVSRDGHVNVNQRERLTALRAVNDWIESGRQSLPPPRPNAPFFDATAAPEPLPSRVIVHDDRQGFDTRVIEVSAIYGNVFIDAQPADFATVGIEGMAWFQLIVGERSFRTLHGRDFASVKRGEWVAFGNADGFYWLARNYGDAAATADLQVGSVVSIRRYPTSAKK